MEPSSQSQLFEDKEDSYRRKLQVELQIEFSLYLLYENSTWRIWREQPVLPRVFYRLRSSDAIVSDLVQLVPGSQDYFDKDFE